MENKLKSLFEFQKFAKNKNLQKIIDDTDSRLEAREYALDDGSLSFAVGGRKTEPEETHRLKDENNKKDNVL